VATKTFLFVDQVGSTEQLTRLGDGTAQVVRRALFDLLREATAVAGGHEVDFTGDGLFCAFDGAAEAVDAAVSMQQLVWSYNGRHPADHRVAIRVGLNSGEPLESEGGGWFGTAVVVAARLCAAAGAGQVLVSPLVRGLVEPRGVHVFSLVGPLELKGVPAPVAASAVTWEPDLRRPPVPQPLAAARTAPFVGRRAELTAVDAAWERAAGGSRQLVAVSGERGSGVTRLVAEAAHRVHQRGGSVWAGRAQGPDARLAAVAEAVGTWTAAVPRAELRLAAGPRAPDLLRLLPDLALLLPGLPAPPPVDPGRELLLVADAVDELAARWSAVEPLLVVLDDLQDADPGTLTVLRGLVGSPRGGRVLVLAGYEPGSVGTPRVLAALQDAGPALDLRLRGLDEQDVSELVRAVIGEPVDGGSLRAVLAESEGSPWFVLQMARSLRERLLARQVHNAVDHAGELRRDLRLQREEISLVLRELQQLREPVAAPGPVRLDPDGTPPAPGTSPYRGLLAFREEDAEVFFGRDALVTEMVARLLSGRFLAVVGPSGSGKSSAVRAGLLPALARGDLPGSDRWGSAVCTPGPDPLAALAGALAPGVPAEEATGRLAHEPLAALVAADRRTVLVVDQAEELWTVAPEAARHRVQDLLVEAATGDDERVLVVLCLRADHYGRTAEHPALAALLAESQVLVSPMTTAELRAAVEQPARRAGWVLEPGLAQVVVDDVAGEPGGLPLLSTAMQQTWERRRGRSLTLAGYAGAGGARRAIAALADATVDELDPADQAVARRLLLRLAAPTAEGTDVARPAPLAELAVDDATRRVLGRLTERRLVTVGRATAQVAHEALLREWPRLRRWLETDRDGRRLHQQVATAAVEWATSGRDDGALLRGARLAAADDWRADHDPELSDLVRDYLDASVAARQRELLRARRTTRRVQLLAGVLVLLLAGAAVATGLAVVRGREAVDRAADATARGLAASAIATSASSVDTALLLAVEGYRRAPSTDTEAGLLTALNAARLLAAYRDGVPRDVHDTALSPDGRTLAVLTASDLQLVDVATWRPRGEPLVRGISAPGSVTFDATGGQLAWTDRAGAHVVDARTGQPVGPVVEAPVGTRVVLSTDGGLLAVDGAGAASTLRIVDRRTGTPLAVLPAAAADLRPGRPEVAVALNGPTASVQRFGLDGRPLAPPVTLPGGGGLLVRFTPDGGRLLATSVDGVTVVLDPDTLTPVGRPIGGSGTSARAFGDIVVDVAFAPHAGLVALALSSGTVLVADATDGSLRTTVSGLGRAPALTFLDDHRLLAASQGRAAEYDLDQVTPIGAVTRLQAPISRLLLPPGGDRAVTGQSGAVVEVGPQGAVGPTAVRLPVETEGPMAVSPDGRLVGALGYPPGYHFTQAPDPGLPPVDFPDGVLVVADSRTGQVLVRTTVAGDEDAPVEGAMAFSPDGRRLAVGTLGGVVTVLDSRTGSVLAQRQTDAAAVRVLRWSSDGTVLQEGGGDGVLRFLDPGRLEARTEVRVRPGVGLTSVVDVPRSGLLAVATENGEVHFVDPARGTEAGQPLAAQVTMLLGLAASPGGARIAGVGWDGALRLWDRASGRAIGPPMQTSGEYTRAIAWFDETHLLTGSFRGLLVAWDMTPAHWADRACGLAARDLTTTEWARWLPDQPYRRTCTG
jgi:class 3 adenylate cyclase/WD40 repeat protein